MAGSRMTFACAAAIALCCSGTAFAFVAPDRIDHPERLVRIAAFTWSKARIEDMEATFTIASALPFAVTDVEVVCTHYARSGVELASARRTIHALLPAHGRIDVSRLDMGLLHAQAASSSCQIVRVSPA